MKCWRDGEVGIGITIGIGGVGENVGKVCGTVFETWTLITRGYREPIGIGAMSSVEIV